MANARSKEPEKPELIDKISSHTHRALARITRPGSRRAASNSSFLGGVRAGPPAGVPMWDQIIKWASFAASLATIAAIFFLIQQIRLERSARDEERTERKKQLARQRNTVLWSLRAEINAIRMAVEMDLKEFRPEDMSNPRVKKAAQDMQIEQAVGDMAYYRSFVWTTLPTSTIEQAIREADLLSLTSKQVEALQGLRLRILRSNSLVSAKISLLPNLVDVQQLFEAGAIVPKAMYQEQPGLGPSRWVDIKLDRLTENIQSEFTGILNESNAITEWLVAISEDR